MPGSGAWASSTCRPSFLDPKDFPPAPAQGAICIESRIGDDRMTSLLAAINDRRTYDAVTCERAFLEALDGSCRTPIAGYARCNGDQLSFSGMILTPDGSRYHEIEMNGARSEALAIGRTAGEAIRAKAGPDFFASWS